MGSSSTGAQPIKTTIRLTEVPGKTTVPLTEAPVKATLRLTEVPGTANVRLETRIRQGELLADPVSAMEAAVKSLRRNPGDQHAADDLERALRLLRQKK